MDFPKHASLPRVSIVLCIRGLSLNYSITDLAAILILHGASRGYPAYGYARKRLKLKSVSSNGFEETKPMDYGLEPRNDETWRTRVRIKTSPIHARQDQP